MRRWSLVAGIALLCTGAAIGAFVFLTRPSGQPAPAPKSAPIDIAATQAKAESGEATAQVQLARLYEKGEGVTNSYAEAAKWFRRAADQTNSDALLGLGELYQAGQGVPKDLAEAVKLYRQAAELGNPDGQYTLAFMYESGNGVRQSHAEAAKWYQLAANQGLALAQYDLGQRYNLGVGVPLDRVEGLKWLILAAAQGQTDAATLRDKVKSDLSHAQVAEAERRAAAFTPGKPLR